MVIAIVIDDLSDIIVNLKKAEKNIIMPIEAKPDFVKMEQDILNLWDERDCFNKLHKKNKNNKRFRFLNGSITENNPMPSEGLYRRTPERRFLFAEV